MSSVNKADSQRWGRAAQERDGEEFNVPEKWLLGREMLQNLQPLLPPPLPSSLLPSSHLSFIPPPLCSHLLPSQQARKGDRL